MSWQLDLKPEDYFVNEQPVAGIVSERGTQQFDTKGITIYVHIEKVARYKGFFWCTAYSEFVPDGEQGIQCIVDATRPITKDEFEQARARGWKAATPQPKRESRYKYHPAFSEGQAAHDEGERRGHNPYSAGGKQAACLAWWDGWDAAWEEAHSGSES